MRTDELYNLVEDTANMLRGMTLDPAIPAHAKGAMQNKIQELEDALELICEQQDPLGEALNSGDGIYRP